MKRFIFWFVAALIAISVLRQHRRNDGPSHEPAHHRAVVVHRFVPQGTSQPAYYIDGDKSRLEPNLARLKNRYGDRIVFAFDDEDEDDNDGVRRVPADGLPVPIVPGSRVTEARPEPPKPPMAPKAPAKAKGKSKRPEPPKTPQPPAPVETASMTGRLSATEERAKKDAEYQLGRKMVDKLGPEIDGSWEIPSGLLQAMILETNVIPHERSYGTVYDATLKVDVSPARRAAIVGAYHHEKLLKRLAMMGGGLVFVLTCLGAVSGYIRTDEKTKGYYTNALRLGLAGGVGAAGFAIYRALA